MVSDYRLYLVCEKELTKDIGYVHVHRIGRLSIKSLMLVSR